jgi:5,10-methylenetetrahydromethanopterin reductase
MSPAIGVVFPANAPAEHLPRFASVVEQAGFDELWLIEDCFLSGGLTMAATALTVTKRLHVGVGLLPAMVRNPALVSMEISVLAHMHPGRFSGTFGHGVRTWMNQIGALPGNRLKALEEVVSAVRGLLAGETVTASGSHVRLRAVKLERPPEVVPRILIGSTGPKGLAVAGRAADGFLLAEGCGPRMLSWARGRVARAAPPGRPRPRSVAYAWLALDEDDEHARVALRPAVDHWLRGGLYPDPIRLAQIDGPLPPGPIARALADELAVVGDYAACEAAVERFAAAGADAVVLAAVGPDFEQQYLQFAAGVLPRLRARRTAA